MHKDIPDLFKKNTEAEPIIEANVMAQKAANAISGLTQQYLDQVKADVILMKDLLKRAEKAKEKERFHLIRDEFFLKVHDMKGQGSTFGYPLLTEVGAYACNYLRKKKEITLDDLQILARIIVDVEQILEENLTGLGGLAGSEIRTHLVGIPNE